MNINISTTKHISCSNHKGGAKIDKRKKNAIFMMCIVADHYVLGACIASYCHRIFLEKLNVKDQIDIVMMCDDYIYDKYNKLLLDKMFFDKVIKIKELHKYDIADRYEMADKYRHWIGMSLNKWQVLNHTEYHKIMFVDIALIPVRTDFYKLFRKDVPAFIVRNKNKHNAYKFHPVDKPKSDLSFDDFLENNREYGTIYGKLAMLKPSIRDYDDYRKKMDLLFDNVDNVNDLHNQNKNMKRETNKIKYMEPVGHSELYQQIFDGELINENKKTELKREQGGIYSLYISSPDETTIFYYFLTKNTGDVYSIPKTYAVVPWETPNIVSNAKTYSYTSMIKPWTKPNFLSWDEELLWYDLYKIIIQRIDNNNNKKMLIDLHNTTILNSYIKYKDSNEEQQKKYYHVGEKSKSKIDNLKKFDDNDVLLKNILIMEDNVKNDTYGPLYVEELMGILLNDKIESVTNI